MEQFSRSNLLIKEENTIKLNSKVVLLCGIGGVGSYVFESLVRMGVGTIIIVDYDVVSISNINRQLIATHSTIGKYKVDVAKERALDINPKVNIIIHNTFINDKTINDLFNYSIDYIVDAIDTVSAKLLLIEKAKELNIPIISSMGTGNKLDPSKLKITDISKTEYCPLAKVMRYELRKRNIKHLVVLTSSEVPIKIDVDDPKIIGSVSYVPSVGGLLISSKVINDLLL